MEREKLEGMLIDYIDNKLNSVDRHQVEQEIVRNPEAYKLYEELKEVMHLMDRSARLEPGVKLKNSFDAVLAEEIKAEKKTRVIFFQPILFKVAAAIARVAADGRRAVPPALGRRSGCGRCGNADDAGNACFVVRREGIRVVAGQEAADHGRVGAGRRGELGSCRWRD